MQLSDVRIFVEPQIGASYHTLLALALRADSLGFGGFFRSDHYLTMSDWDGLPGSTDAWATLAGLARDTRTIRLGTLVSPVTFRHPGPLAITVAQVDEMSGGRVELGLGAGWYEREHEAYAIPFPPMSTRFDMLEDQLAIIDGLWNTATGSTFTFHGKVHSVVDSPALPKPVQQQVPIIVGGGGAVRTPALAARYATEFNQFKPFDEFALQVQRVRAACMAIGRTRPMVYSGVLIACAGATDAEVARRGAAIHRDPAELRAEKWACGTADEVASVIRTWVDAGVERLYLQVLDMHDLDHLDFIAEEVIPRV